MPWTSKRPSPSVTRPSAVPTRRPRLIEIRPDAISLRPGSIPTMERRPSHTTSSAAELMGLQDELGTLEPGKRADVVVLEGDPFDFEKLEQRVRTVYKDGARVVG